MNIQLFRAIRPSNVRSANRTKSKTLMLLTAITVLATLPISVGLSAQQKFTTIDVPGATFTDASGINPRGDIVGLYFDTSGNRHGFLLSNGTFTTIDVPVAIFTDPSAIDPQGDISGFYTDSSGNTHGFLLSNGDLRPSMYREPFSPTRMRLTREATSWEPTLTAAATLMVSC